MGQFFEHVHVDTALQAIQSCQVVEERTVFVCAGHRVARLTVSGASKAKLAMQVEKCAVSTLSSLLWSVLACAALMQ